jgi:hypothetical protein
MGRVDYRNGTINKVAVCRGIGDCEETRRTLGTIGPGQSKFDRVNTNRVTVAVAAG